jgi:LysR family transcriptional regulator, glycine cleavage system transcriptional activator
MSWDGLPPLGTLVAFEATVRHRSVSRAAEELHLTHGAISRQIQQLERALGIALFERRPREMSPTPAAVVLAGAVADALTLLSSAARRARQSTQPGPLVLSCEPTVLMRWLIPRLPGLATSVPGLDLRLSAAGGPLSFDRDGIDVAIRRDDFTLPSEVRAFWLFDEFIGPVCTPALGKRLSGPENLSELPRLHTRTRPTAWEDWARCGGTTLVPAREQTFEHFYLSLQAAAAGLGVAVGPLALVHDDVKAGQLAAPFGFEPDGSGYFLLTTGSRDDERISALLAWLRGQAEELALGGAAPALAGSREWKGVQSGRNPATDDRYGAH